MFWNSEARTGFLWNGNPKAWGHLQLEFQGYGFFLGKSTNELMMLLLKARYKTSIDWSCMYSCSFTKEKSICNLKYHIDFIVLKIKRSSTDLFCPQLCSSYSLFHWIKHFIGKYNLFWHSCKSHAWYLERISSFAFAYQSSFHKVKGNSPVQHKALRKRILSLERT